LIGVSAAILEIWSQYNVREAEQKQQQVSDPKTIHPLPPFPSPPPPHIILTIVWLQDIDFYINHPASLVSQSKRMTRDVQNLAHLGHEHQAPDQKATKLMMGY
jgi:hypothetical protein